MKSIDKSNYTPMMRQYLTIKEQYNDSLLFFRLGDFYELFFDDAHTASETLEIALTGREAGTKERVPMCGVPYHSAEGYIQRLIDYGFKVAICEQVEDPKEAKGIVKRDVVRLITPGTVMENGFIDERTNNFITTITEFETNFGVAYCDLTTGELYVSLLDKNEKRLLDEVLSVQGKELVVSKSFDHESIDTLKNHYGLTVSYESEISPVTGYHNLTSDLIDSRLTATINRLINYLVNTQKRNLEHIQKAKIYSVHEYLKMDVYSKRNLEISETLRSKTRKGSLLWLVDQSQTAMGGRLIKQWLDRPLIDKQAISRRYDIVQAFIDDFITREEIKKSLKNVYDLERLVGRISYGTANARDLMQLKSSLSEIPFIKEQLKTLNKEQKTDVNLDFDTFDPLFDLLDESINEEAPISLKDGGLIKDGFNEELDKLRDASTNGRKWIAELVAKEKERTGIKSLKVGFNKVFGYYIEIRKTNMHLLPEDSNYERKQTLTNSERFITPELKEKESMILGADEKAMSLEYELFVSIRDKVKQYMNELQKLAKRIAEIDALISFSLVSEENRFVRPKLTDKRHVDIKNGRHPVVEKVMKDSVYVENDVTMDGNTDLLLITGPNMSGKSTYMRQMALTVILAQVGCFVPADSATLPIFDKIFTRIGASDDLISGQSTFMVEMLEANNAILNATADSLIIFDEIGRGTATYDGMALAQSIIEYIHENIKAKTMFSTHYHELTNLEESLKRLKNVHVKAKEDNGELTFLHKVEFGPTDKSYGIQVAKLAELPVTLIKRSEAILKRLESNKESVLKEDDYNLFSLDFGTEEETALSPLSQEEQEVLETLENTNIFELTPIEAMNTLYKLQNKLKSNK
ncbi:DNA mismatch repair protein MutS [Haloplasma contractile]|uniref:DNA mismatch repair protein MutS n=1 Tax=Haloplasma contractile SSD-17B TaxID=1033810 RepID=U2FRS3_9MOLU|nr:DNA mismatch repair protein MutS [Haloplasma contractile]ERJ13664.1 DNA mismatch repair protein MutS [Haloplasma contractile SSD-17B]